MDGPCDPDGLLVVLTPGEAMTVVAALRQYEPYWSPRVSPTAVSELLTDTREHIDSVLAKLREAAAFDSEVG